ncbi:hypothetical protein ACX8XN_04245 [Calditrichota bacterium GD2]
MKIFVIIFFVIGLCNAQFSNNIIFLNEEIYDYYDYSVTKGHLKVPFILNQPYRIDRIQFNIHDHTHNNFEAILSNVGEIYEDGHIVGYLSAKDFLKKDENFKNLFWFDGGITFTNNLFTLSNKFAFNQEYKYDPNFAGNLSDADHWIFGRFNEAFIDIYPKNFEIFFGRTSRNWGPLGEYSLILSDFPYSYDHLYFSYQFKRFKYSFLFAKLDSRNSPAMDFVLDKIITVKAANRYLVGHRYELYLSDKLQLGFTQMTTYGGEKRLFEWAFLNPMNVNFLVQHNERLESNSFLAFDWFWKPSGKTAFWGQFLGDDIVINNDPGENATSKFPNRFGVLMSFKIADMGINKNHLVITYTRLWNFTYLSVFTWQNYHYRNYSLGYPSPSLEEYKLKFSLWKYFPFYISNEIIYGRYGNVKITDIFPQKKTPFPLAPVTYNFINHLKLRYYASNRLRLFSDIWYRKEPVHYSNRYAERGNWVVKLGFQYLANFSFGVD